MHRVLASVLALLVVTGAGRPVAAADCSKRYCRQMRSCGEAYAVMRSCGLRRLDGDGDGIPCEAICRDGLPPALQVLPPAAVEGFSCRPLKRCKEMSGCAEARFQLETCGNHGLDRDRDGTPCEAIC